MKGFLVILLLSFGNVVKGLGWSLEGGCISRTGRTMFVVLFSLLLVTGYALFS